MNHLELRSHQIDINFLSNHYQNQNFTEIWNSTWTLPKLFPLIPNCSKLMGNTSNPHSNFNSQWNQLFIPLLKIRLLIINSTLQISKLSQNIVNEFKLCQLTNASILVPTTTTQTPILTLRTTISPFGVVANHPDHHTLATIIGNHPDTINWQSPWFPKFFSNWPPQLFKFDNIYA